MLKSPIKITFTYRDGQVDPLVASDPTVLRKTRGIVNVRS